MKQRVAYYSKKWKQSKVYALASRHPHRTEFLLIGAFFAALAALFMGPILWHFGSSVHGFWGDGTGGLIWLNTLGLGPFGGLTNAVIYPFGDNLFRPEFITAFFFVMPFWLVAKVVGAVAAWNTIIFVSFWLCGVSMYYLVKRLTSSPLAALWAGVAFAYMPMHQYKAFGHIAYVMTFVFVFVLWFILNFLEKPSRRNAIILGLAFAVPFYIDGYYVLFTLILAGVPLAYVFIRQLWSLGKKTADDFKALLRGLLLFAATSFVALLPVIYTKLMYGAQISASLAMARGDFMSNVVVYTARWYDFVIPIETHPVFGHWATAFRTTHNHGSNPSEDTLYLGFTVLALAAWTLYFFWKRRKATKDPVATPAARRTMAVLVLVALVALAISLPPFVHVMGHKVPMPSGVLSHFVQYWRVYARLILIIQLVAVVIAAFGLAVLLQRIKKPAAVWLAVILLIGLTFFEYLSFNPFHRQDIWYYGKLSSANRWLARQNDIKAIAVYPLVDQPNGLASLYTTEQPIHGKKMLNSGTVSNKATRLRASISGLNDPQTLPVLKALGIQAVMTHEIPNDRSVAGLQLAHSANEAPAGYAADVDVYKLADDIPKAQVALLADQGFVDKQLAELTTRYYLADNGVSELRTMAMPGSSDSAARITFRLYATSGYHGNDIVVSQGDRVLDVLSPKAGQNGSKQYDVDPAKPVRLTVVGSMSKETLYITDLRAQTLR